MGRKRKKSKDFRVPKWALKYAGRMVSMLGLQHCDITMRRRKLKPGDGAYAPWAMLDSNYPYPDAQITIAPFITNDRTGHEAILHELLHLAMEPMNRTVFRMIGMIPDERAAQVSWAQYRDQHELVVSRMARAIVGQEDLDK